VQMLLVAFSLSDTLLARLQGQPVSGQARCIHGDADQSPGKPPLELLAHRHKRRVGTTEAEGHTEPLAIPNRDIGPPFTRRLMQTEIEQIGGDDDETATIVDPLHQVPAVRQSPFGIGHLEERTEYGIVWLEGSRVADDRSESRAVRRGFRTTARVWG